MTITSYTCTVAYGTVADDLGVIRHNHPRLDMRTDLRHLPSTNYRRTQRQVDVHIDHNRLIPVGKLDHLELDNGRLMAVASLFDDNIDHSARWYWSPSVDYRTAGSLSGEDIVLEELSLTTTPAAIGLPPSSSSAAPSPKPTNCHSHPCSNERVG